MEVLSSLEEVRVGFVPVGLDVDLEGEEDSAAEEGGEEEKGWD